MTVKRRVVRRRIPPGKRRITSKKYVPPKLPDSPPVDRPRSYGKTKKGRHIIPRFIASPYVGTRKVKHWWVIDMDTANVAEGTEPKGYKDKKEAKRIAEDYRDEFGAWSTMPF